LRPLTFLSDNNAISLNLLKAKYGFKKEYITCVKNGSVIIEFIPLNKDEFGKVLFNIQNKKKFLLDLTRIGDILALPKDIGGTFDKEMNYSVVDPKTEAREYKNLRFLKAAGEDAVFIRYQNKLNEENVTFNYKLTMGEYHLLHNLLDYSVPYVIGWHAIASKKLVEDDLNE